MRNYLSLKIIIKDRADSRVVGSKFKLKARGDENRIQFAQNIIFKVMFKNTPTTPIHHH